MLAVGMLCVLLLGTAGAGKSTMVSALSKLLGEVGEQHLAANLDPGAEYIPYKPDYDVREHFTVRSIMSEEGLGPNSAQVRAVERIAEQADELLKPLWSSGAEVVLVDTPGQLEIFAFREAGPRLVSYLQEKARVAGVFLIDAALPSTLAETVLTLTLAKAVELRLEAPMVAVLNKVDVLPEGRRALLKRMVEEMSVDEAVEAVYSDSSGLVAEMAAEIAGILVKYRTASRVALASAISGEGLKEVYDLLNEIFCVCGDTT